MNGIWWHFRCVKSRQYSFLVKTLDSEHRIWTHTMTPRVTDWCQARLVNHTSPVQRQTAVTDHLESEQLLLFVFAGRQLRTWRGINTQQPTIIIEYDR